MVPCRSPEWENKAHYCSPTNLLSLARPSREYGTEGFRDSNLADSSERYNSLGANA
jgi:hypothetical protein